MERGGGGTAILIGSFDQLTPGSLVCVLRCAGRRSANLTGGGSMCLLWGRYWQGSLVPQYEGSNPTHPVTMAL